MKKFLKKFLITLFSAVVAIGASAQDGKLAVNAGFLFPSTLNATVGYEHPLSYGNAVELYGEAGTHWQASALSSARYKSGSSSDWREGLNTAMCSKTAGSSP